MATFKKVNGVWNAVSKTFFKDNGTWKEAKTFLKSNGAWDQVAGLRNVANFNGVSQYAVAPRVDEIDLDDPNLAFEVEFDLNLVDLTSTYLIGADTYHTQNGTAKCLPLAIYILGGKLKMGLGGNYQTVLYEGEFSPTGTLSITYSGGEVVATSGGISKTLLFVIGDVRDGNGFAIGASYDATNGAWFRFLNGCVYSLRIWTGGDRNTGTLTRHYRMDEGWRGDNNQVLVNYATELGEELAVNGDFSDGLTGWDVIDELGRSSVVNGQFVVQGTGGGTSSNVTITNIVASLQKTTHLVTTDVESGVLRAPLNGLYNYTIRSGVMVQSAIPHDTALRIRTYHSDESVTNSISYKRADGYGTYIGLTEASWTEETV